MAYGLQNSIHNSLWFLQSTTSSSSLYYPINFGRPRLKDRNHFQKLTFSSSSNGALSCSCSSSTSNPNYCEKSSQEADTFVLTTPLYYVNAPPHMGSAYTTIAADSIARFQRLLGKNVIFITGTDEHGEKIATAAAASGSSPAEHCDTVSRAYKALWRDLGISYDKFIRTTDSKHEAIVKEFYSKVFASGDIYRADYEGLYCVNCEEYKDSGNQNNKYLDKQFSCWL